MNSQKDYYSILQVNADASKEEIRAAYRKLAKRHHPDLHGDGADDSKFKEINEANDILSDESSRQSYDQLRDNLTQKVQTTESNSSIVRPPTIKRYERRYTVEEVHKIYLTGFMSMKYWAEEQSHDQKTLSEKIFELHPTHVLFKIRSSDIFQNDIPADYRSRWAGAEVFKTPLKQPVHTEITDKTNSEFYALNLEDIRIAEPRLVDISKIENENLGTLEAAFYGYTTKIVQLEKTEWTEEYSGLTGRVETKTENERVYLRHESYEKNGSTSWGSWIPNIHNNSYGGGSTPGSNTGGSTNKGSYAKSRGSGYSYGNNRKQETKLHKDNLQNWLLAIVALCFILMFPGLFSVLLALLLGILVLAFIGTILSFFRKFAGFVFLAIALTLIGITLFSSHPKVRGKNADNTANSRDYIKTTIELEPSLDSASKGQTQQPDTLIRHIVRWFDYDSSDHNITLAIKKSSVESASIYHAGLYRSPVSNLGMVYQSFAQNDLDKLTYIYDAFDSIRIQKKLNQRKFAEMIVSCVQSIPYFLVVDGTCSPGSYADQFIKDYLRTCTGECCVGGIAFGVRSPVEFLSDLKGDCDTRSLFIYTILTHFKYDVAVITSDSYRHAALAINLGEPLADQESIFERNGKSYYFWETTAKNFPPGLIPKDCDNLSKWQIKTINN
jgi:energy-coupling factor transporter transmembrane protein EcfT